MRGVAAGRNAKQTKRHPHSMHGDASQNSPELGGEMQRLCCFCGGGGAASSAAHAAGPRSTTSKLLESAVSAAAAAGGSSIAAAFFGAFPFDFGLGDALAFCVTG
eukprot:7506347-Pyramimonas_sp.AAC.1